MKLLNYILLLLVISILSPIVTLADNDFSNKSTVEFFASNNTHEIDLQTAFNRLQGKEQQKLQNDSIDLMQKEHMEQSKFVNLLGTYKMAADQNMTADNSEKIMASPYQKLSSEKVFKLAAALANVLKQESVAVFIPSKKPVIGDTILKLKSHHYTINEIITIIHDTLPAQYSEAFSLHLSVDGCSNFDNAIVDEAEWLGSKIQLDDIKKSFPQEEIVYYYGSAFLVYKNGQKEQL